MRDGAFTMAFSFLWVAGLGLVGHCNVLFSWGLLQSATLGTFQFYGTQSFSVRMLHETLTGSEGYLCRMLSGSHEISDLKLRVRWIRRSPWDSSPRHEQKLC